MRTAAPISLPCTTGYRPACRPRTTSWAGSYRWASSRRWSKRHLVALHWDEPPPLVDLGAHTARFALILAGALNVFLYALGPSTDIIDNVPQHLRFAVAIVAGLYAVLSVYNLIQAVESLRPRRAQPYVHYSTDTGGFEEYPLGLRFYEDI